VIPIADLFPPEDYRFHLSLRRGDLKVFFAPSPDAPAILAERREWLSRDPARYAALEPDGAAVLAEWSDLVERWGIRGTTCHDLGGQLEPDFLLLVRDPAGDFRLRGGALVFPTTWALEDKLGQTLDEIHDVVPGLNRNLSAPINQFLHRLKPGGPAFLRFNWGLAATAALNLHPSQPRPALTVDVEPSQVWLRVEHQILAALATSGGLVFGIRIALHPLKDVIAETDTRRGFHRALRTMPDALAAYKGLLAARPRLLELSRD
jgi:dimethylamine monooxygenase subunit A